MLPKNILCDPKALQFAKLKWNNEGFCNVLPFKNLNTTLMCKKWISNETKARFVKFFPKALVLCKSSSICTTKMKELCEEKTCILDILKNLFF